MADPKLVKDLLEKAQRKEEAARRVATQHIRVAQLEKQATLQRGWNTKVAKRILKEIEKDVQKGYKKWLTDQLLPFQLELSDLDPMSEDYMDPWNVFESAISPSHQKNDRRVKSQSEDEFTVEMRLNDSIVTNLTIVFDEISRLQALSEAVNLYRTNQPAFTVYIDGKKAFHLKKTRDIKNGLAWKHILKALRTELRELGGEIEDYTRGFIEKNLDAR